MLRIDMSTLEELIETARTSGHTPLHQVVSRSSYGDEADSVRRRFALLANELEKVAHELLSWDAQALTLQDNLAARLQGLADRMADPGAIGQPRLDDLASALRDRLLMSEQQFQQLEQTARQLDTQRRAAIENATSALDDKLASADDQLSGADAARRKAAKVATTLDHFVGRATVLADRSEITLLRAERAFELATEAKITSAHLAGRTAELDAEIADLQNAGDPGDDPDEPNDPADGNTDPPADAADMIAARQAERDELSVQQAAHDGTERRELNVAIASLAYARDLRSRLADDNGPASLDRPFPIFNANGGADPQSRTRLEQAWTVARDDWRTKIETLSEARLEALGAELALLTKQAEHEAWLAERAESGELQLALNDLIDA
jgi:hypothetical protein